MTTEKAQQVAHMAMEHAAAWSAGDPGKIAELFAEDGAISVNGGDPHVGRAAISENAKELLATFPGLVVHCHQTRQAADRAVYLDPRGPTRRHRKSCIPTRVARMGARRRHARQTLSRFLRC